MTFGYNTRLCSDMDDNNRSDKAPSNADDTVGRTSDKRSAVDSDDVLRKGARNAVFRLEGAVYSIGKRAFFTFSFLFRCRTQMLVCRCTRNRNRRNQHRSSSLYFFFFMNNLHLTSTSRRLYAIQMKLLSLVIFSIELKIVP